MPSQIYITLAELVAKFVNNKQADEAAVLPEEFMTEGIEDAKKWSLFKVIDPVQIGFLRTFP